MPLSSCNNRILRQRGVIFLIIIVSIVLPPITQNLSDASSPRFDPSAFGLPHDASEVVRKRTDKAVTFEVSTGKFAAVSIGADLPSPSCSSAKLPSLCQMRTSLQSIIPVVFAASEGPNSPSTGADDASVGSLAWASPSSITTSDDSYSVASRNLTPLTTHYLKATGYGFAIPDGATIDGVVVEIERKCSGDSGTNYCKDEIVSLVKGGTVQGDNNGDTVTNWVITEAYFTYGGISDLWGLALTAADINASDFGAVLTATIRGNA